ncbi:MAG: hypothetical protein AB1449_15545, partial [Chloroflexota bacterium]
MARENARAERREEEARRQAGLAGLAALAAAAVEAARRRQDLLFEERELRREKEEMAARARAEAEAQELREPQARISPPDDDERRAAAATSRRAMRETAERRDEPVEEGRQPNAPTSPSRNSILPLLRLINNAGEWIRGAVRGERALDVAMAARQVTTTEVGETIRILGPRAARDTLGLREYVNWVRPENSGLIAQSATSRALGSLVSPGTLAGITLGLATDTQMYL